MMHRWFKRRPKADKTQAAAASKQDKLAAALLTTLAAAAPAAALPTGGTVVATSGGTTTFTNPTPTQLVVNQGARRVVIDWAGGFNIATGERVTFRQGDNRFIAVNRVVGSTTTINGILEGLVPNPTGPGDVFGGNIWIINQNGVLFGANARVDVHGLLATTANLVNPAAFVTAADGDPIAFAGPAAPTGGVQTANGSEIRAHGGPVMLVAGGGNTPFSNLSIIGSVTSAGSTDQQNSSQVLYGAARAFTLRFGATAPNAVSSGDLDLFDFIIDQGYEPVAITPFSWRLPIRIESTSTTRAGQVIIAGVGGVLEPLPVRPSLNIFAPVTATGNRGQGADLLVNGAGGMRNGVADGVLSQSTTGVFVQRVVGVGAPGGGVGTLFSQALLQSAGGLVMQGRFINTAPAISVSSAPDTWFAPTNVGVVLRAGQGRPVLAAGVGGVDLSGTDAGGAIVTSLGNVNLRSGLAPFNVFSVEANGEVWINEDAYENGVFTTTPSLVADLTGITSIRAARLNLITRGRVAVGDITGIAATGSNGLFVWGDQGVTAGSITGGAGNFINLRATAGAISTGAISAGGTVLAQAGGVGGITINGAVSGQGFININALAGPLNIVGPVALAGGGGTLGLYGTGITAGALSSTGGIDINGRTGAITFGAVTAANNISIINSTGTAAVQTGAITATTGQVAVFGGGAVTVGGAVQAGLTATGANAIYITSRVGGVTTGVLTAPNAPINITGSGGAVSIAGFSGTTPAINVFGSSGVTVGSAASAVGAARFNGGSGAVTLGDLTSGGDLTVSTGAASIRTGALRSTGSGVSVSGGGRIDIIGPIAAQTFVTISAPLGVVRIGAPGDPSDPNGQITPASVSTATGQALIVGRDGVTVGAVTGGTSVNLQSSVGAVQAGALTTTSGGLFVSGQTGVTTGAISVTGAAANPTASGAFVQSLGGGVAVGSVTGTGAIQLSGQTGLTVGGPVDAGTSVVLGGGAGGVSVGLQGAPASVRARTASAQVTGAAGVSVGGVSAATLVSLSSTAGAVQAGNLTSTASSVVVGGQTGVAAGAISAATSINVSSATGSVSLGGVTGQVLTVSASPGAFSGPGNVTISGPVTLTTPAMTSNSIFATGTVTLGGPITIDRIGTPTGPITGLNVTSAQGIIVNGAITSQNGVSFRAANGVFRNTAPIRVLSYFGQPATSTSWFDAIRIEALDVELGGQLFARGLNGTNVAISFGATHTDGVGVGDGLTRRFQISNAEYQLLDSGIVAISGLELNSQNWATATGNVAVGDLTIDRARTALLILGTGAQGTLRFQGTVRGIGAPEIVTGFFSGSSIFMPRRLEIVGRLGTLDAPIGNLQLRARQDILFGSQAFLDAFDAAPDKTTFDPLRYRAGFGGIAPGHLFAVARTGNITSHGHVMQQNTGVAAFDGVRFGLPTPTTFGLIYASNPTFEPGQPTRGPTRVELFGTVIDRNNAAQSGRDAALAPGMLSSNVAQSDLLRINGCVIGSGDGCRATASPIDPVVITPPRTDPIDEPEDPLTEDAANPTIADSGSGFSAGDVELRRRDAGVGAANEDLWPTAGR
jgi:filamentous hemagglutinin family protein